MKELNEQDRERIEINNPHGKGAWYEFNAWKQGAEYATLYEREKVRELLQENERLKEDFKVKVDYYENKQESMQKSIDDWYNQTIEQSKRIAELETEVEDLKQALSDYDSMTTIKAKESERNKQLT